MALEYCSYHPLAPATYTCPHCGTGNCDNCIDEGDRGNDALCYNCKRAVDSLGAVNHAVPFWRRLEESFRYPMNGNAIGMIVGVSVLTSVLLYLPFGFVLYLMLTGAFIKYCFTALDNTAIGLLVPPDVTEAYSGGLVLILRLLVIFFAIGGAAFGIFHLLGPEFAGLFTFLSIMALPAIIIVFAMSDSLAEALNPAHVLRLISSIGLPYGLLLGFIMVMTASVGVINTLLAGHFSLLSTILQSTVSNYYTLVLFHIMGYMIFQYQGALGFTAREDTGENKPPRSERDHLATKIDIRLKEGEYNDVVGLLKTALGKFPNDREFQKQYFEFLYATERLEALEEAATNYLTFLIRSGQDHQLSMIYKRVLHLIPNFVPNSAPVRHLLAITCKNNGDPLSAAKLINGIQKAFPDYEQLPEALELMADALEELPNKSAQAAKCRELAKHFAGKKPQPKTKAKPEKTAVKASPKPGGRAVFQIDSGPLPPPVKSPVGLELEENKSPASSESISQNTESNSDLPPIEFK